jgi:phytoene dehydrogenase-like protein
VSDQTFDVIVTGAGFGGATCAALLAKRGLRVLLLEKNAQAGGKAMVISKNGFTYELWPVHPSSARTGSGGHRRSGGADEDPRRDFPRRVRTRPSIP